MIADVLPVGDEAERRASQRVAVQRAPKNVLVLAKIVAHRAEAPVVVDRVLRHVERVERGAPEDDDGRRPPLGRRRIDEGRSRTRFHRFELSQADAQEPLECHRKRGDGDDRGQHVPARAREKRRSENQKGQGRGKPYQPLEGELSLKSLRRDVGRAEQRRSERDQQGRRKQMAPHAPIRDRLRREQREVAGHFPPKKHERNRIDGQDGAASKPNDQSARDGSSRTAYWPSPGERERRPNGRRRDSSCLRLQRGPKTAQPCVEERSFRSFSRT